MPPPVHPEGCGRQQRNRSPLPVTSQLLPLTTATADRVPHNDGDQQHDSNNRDGIEHFLCVMNREQRPEHSTQNHKRNHNSQR